MLGFGTMMAVVFSSGGAAKSKQFGTVGGVLAGQHGTKKKGLFVAGIVMALLGTCASFVGVSASDAKRRRVCVETCESKGYANGAIQGSKRREPPESGKHAFVACVCTTGPDPDPLELRADSLVP